METQKIIVIFKEVGKDPIFMKIENNIISFVEIKENKFKLFRMNILKLFLKKKEKT